MSIARVEDALQRRAVLYDKGGDRHYDYISAWIKATRGSDPDASLYYLAVMLEGGEDPRFIVRRMVILASEDIGNADPAALSVAVAAAQAVEHVGLPEAKFALAQAAIYLSLAPKSNAAGRALGRGPATCPRARRGARAGVAALGHEAGTGRSADYDNPHDHPGHVSPQELLPEGVVGRALLRRPTRRRRSWRGAWSRFAGCAGDNGKRGGAGDDAGDDRGARPGDGRRLGSVTATPPERIGEVVAAVAKVQPLWALLRVQDRARYMRRMAQAIIDEFDELVEAIGREQGRPRAEVATLELLAAIDALIWIADDGAKVLGSRRVGIHRSMSLAKRARVAYEPYGVIAVIGAGSAPFAQPLGQIAGALLAGNGVVFKPARAGVLGGRADRAGAGARGPARGVW